MNILKLILEGLIFHILVEKLKNRRKKPTVLVFSFSLGFTITVIIFI